jgi:hypothetical protein
VANLGRHRRPVFVRVNQTKDPGSSSPGVLIEWRRGARGRWEAHVVFVQGGGTTEPRVVIAWVDAAHVQPIG